MKEKFQRLRRQREPFYLTASEFDEILRWKLRGQYARLRSRRETDDRVIREVTQAAFRIVHPDREYQLELRMGILCSLRGVGVPVASAVLALVFPEEYAVIDYRVWRQVFGELKSSFRISDYKRYLHRVSELAKELGWSVQEVDLAIWEYDRRHGRISDVQDQMREEADAPG